MNQANEHRFRKDDGTWQDGGILIHFPTLSNAKGDRHWPDQWVALFLVFQAQGQHSDDRTGHRLPKRPRLPRPIPNKPIKIIAALVNPEGEDKGKETVTLINRSDQAIDLNGWAIADGRKGHSLLSGPIVGAGDIVRILLDGEGARLRNGRGGGIISLLDPAGYKVDGVSYTQRQAAKEAWTVLF